MSHNPQSSRRQISVEACAKINLTLEVLGKRGDGFHELRSLVVGVDLCDRLTFTATLEGGVDCRCNDAGLAGRDNLVVRAAERLAKEAGAPGHVSIELTKAIPVGGGMGGGSSDAAATLVCCNELWRLGLERVKLAEIGAQIGSDVPLFLSLPSVVMTGRGETVTPAELRWSGWALMVFAGPGVPTAEVYRAWRPEDSTGAPPGAIEAIAAAEHASAIHPLLFNHLEPAVFRVAPKVLEAHQRVTDAGLTHARVSGAGSTLFVLFDERREAEETAENLKRAGIGYATAVVRVPVAGGSAAGASFHT